MGEMNRHESFKIPERGMVNNSSPELNTAQSPAERDISFDVQPFAEIEIDSSVSRHGPTPIPVPTKLVSNRDEKRRIFREMRDIGRLNHSSFYENSRFYYKQAQYENSKIFYKQAVFMKDFEDDYTEFAPFSSYYPYYQMLGYEQLRTYFTWRTGVRKGAIENTSLSYAFLYIYELLNNIGVSNPSEGLEKLTGFWRGFKPYDKTIEKYLIKWIKDYHVYYELPQSFRDFLTEYGLQDHYPEIAGYIPGGKMNFAQLQGLSKYNIKQSAFYTDETRDLIAECLDFVIDSISSALTTAGISLNELIYQPSIGKTVWTPFSGALFYPVTRQRDRQVIMSDNEVYVCKQNKWLLSKVVTTEDGKQLVSYIFKQTEAALRRALKYKYKLTAGLEAVGGDITNKLSTAGISLDKLINGAVMQYYREKNKTVVTVDEHSLSRIRLEAQDTQEKLIVPESSTQAVPPIASKPVEIIAEPPPLPQAEGLNDKWTSLKASLDNTEQQALLIALHTGGNIRQFARDKGIMLEVLADGINEKAVDHIGDSILELGDILIIYDEYRENIEMMVN